VVWSGSRLGVTPLDGVAVPCGDAVVALDHPRYERVERKLVASAGAPVVLEQEMERPAGRLDLESTPPGATFTVGGRAVGKAPVAADVSAFTSVRIKAELAGYKPWAQRVYVRGRTYSVHAKLQPLPRPARPRRPASSSPR
jgi:hypothetical protein